LLSDRWARKLMGAAMVLLAVLSVALMLVHSQNEGEHQHTGVFVIQSKNT